MTKPCLNQYKLFFILLWVIPYFIYPSWALPVSDKSRYLIFFGLLSYFLVALYFLNIWFKSLHVDKPFIVKSDGWLHLIRKNPWLSIIGFIAVILHIYPIVVHPILIHGDEAAHIHGGLWVYKYIDSSVHQYFQVIFWMLVVSVFLLIKQKTVRKVFIDNFAENASGTRVTNTFIGLFFCFLIAYFLVLQDIQYHQSIIRYPPLSRLLYLVLYLSFGINHIWPRFLSLAFYIAGALYLYRTIKLSSDDRAALLGSAIYLFFPVTFVYASLAELGSGTVFFIIVVSYYFLRFLKDRNDRDIILTAFLIGLGFLFKRDLLLMLFICGAYLTYYKTKNRDIHYTDSVRILLLSLVPIVPWMIIGKFYSWRNYRIVMSNFVPPDGKLFSYFTHLPSDISWILFTLFVLSIIYIRFYKNNNVSIFFLLLFIFYYIFYALDRAGLSPRLSMAFYPTIAVFTSLFISGFTDRVRWQHAFKGIFIVLTCYLIAISAVPSLNARYLSSPEFIKLRYYPSKKAMQWVRDNVKDNEKILTLRIMTAQFYRDKYGIDKNKIIDYWHSLEDVSTPEKLREVINKNRITYVMFTYSADDPMTTTNWPILQYLKENRDNEFIETAKFNMGKNYIFVYTVPANISEPG